MENDRPAIGLWWLWGGLRSHCYLPLEVAMAKLRHIAMQVPDLEKAAAFYEGVFGLKRVKRSRRQSETPFHSRTVS